MKKYRNAFWSYSTGKLSEKGFHIQRIKYKQTPSRVLSEVRERMRIERIEYSRTIANSKTANFISSTVQGHDLNILLLLTMEPGRPTLLMLLIGPLGEDSQIFRENQQQLPRLNLIQ